MRVLYGGYLDMENRLKIGSLLFFPAFVMGLLISCSQGGGDGSQAVITYTGELKKGCPVTFRGRDSLQPEYYKWSYKEASQADTEYVTVDSDDDDVFFYFIKAGAYNVRLEIKSGVSTVSAVSITDNTSTATRIGFTKGAVSYSTTIYFDAATLGRIQACNDMFKLVFGSVDYKNASLLTGNSYYHNWIVTGDTITLDDGSTTFTGPGFFQYIVTPNRVWINDIHSTAPAAFDSDISLITTYTLTKEEMRKAYYHDLWIEITNGGTPDRSDSAEFRGFVALTDDTVTNFFILKN